MADDTRPLAEQTPGQLSATAIEKLVEVFSEEHLNLLNKDLAVAVQKARAEKDRTAAKAAAAASERMTGASRPMMNLDQQAEWFRCAIARMTGKVLTPREDLDADGIITQGLTPIASSGAYVVLPDEFWAELEKRPPEPSVLWPRITKVPVKSRLIKKPTVTTYITVNTGASANVNSATTATEITETSPVFTQLEWNLEDFDARMPVKLDLLEESPISIYQELIGLCQDAFNEQHEKMPLNGQGHGHQEPVGLLRGIAGITAVAINAAPTASNVLDLASEVPQRYRANAVMVADSDTLFEILQALATSVYSSKFIDPILPPFVESAHMPEGKILCGDLARYVVCHIRLLQVVTSISAERKTQEIVVTETWTGRPTQTDAFRIGTGVTYA